MHTLSKKYLKLFLQMGLLLSLTAEPLAAQEKEYGILYGHDIDVARILPSTEFTVTIYDGVTDGCWVNADRVKSSVERELLDAGYLQIVEEHKLGAEVSIDVIGYGLSSTQCVVHVSFILTVVDTDRRTGEGVDWVLLDYAEPLRFGVLLSGSKSDMSQRILENVQGFVDELIVEIQQAKNRLGAAIQEAENSDSAKAFISSMYE